MSADDTTDQGNAGRASPIRIFLCGDVMTGRGIDQILPEPVNPRLYERYMDSALGYVEIAERAHGAIPRPAEFAYPWGAALEQWARAQPDVRIINLETSITRSEDHARKGINYRMSPENVSCLTAAGIDCCVLANNHVLDWGRAGLIETLEVLKRSNIRSCGAGRDIAAASAPAILEVKGKGRVLAFAFATVTSGTPPDWAATRDRAGVNFLPQLSDSAADTLADQVRRIRKPGDVVVASIHWGPNWGYEIPDEHRKFAHALIDRAGVSIVHGHSSHHPLGIEVYRDRLVLYGSGDFLNDYEGIAGIEDFRSDLSLMYFALLSQASAELLGLDLVPLQMRQFRLHRASAEDAESIRATVDRESLKFGARVNRAADDTFALSWERGERRGTRR